MGDFSRGAWQDALWGPKLTYFVAVDPGKNACAVSIWESNTYSLVHASLVKNPFAKTLGKERAEKWGDMGKAVSRMILDTTHTVLDVSLILEIPQVYDGPQDEDKNDLLDLAGVQGAIVAASGFEVAWSPLPREWKGQLKKHHSVERVTARLSETEFARVQWPIKSLCHNVWDALHLGLVHLEREGLRNRP